MLKLDGSRAMTGNLLPNITNAYYCGNSSKKWVYGYFQKLNAGLSSHLEPLLDATYRLGSATRAWKELYLNTLKTNIDMDGDITVLSGHNIDIINGCLKVPDAPISLAQSMYFSPSLDRIYVHNGTAWVMVQLA